jgi:ketol-acid reductoisomerase
LKILRGEDLVDGRPLDSRTVAVLGFGNQGRAHALNLRDSGCRVIVGTRRGSSTSNEAKEHGLETFSLRDAAANADLLVIALPDEVHGEVFDADLASALRPGTIIGFLHGFSIRYGLVKPRADVGVVLVAPKGPGATLRERYVQGLGIPCLIAVHQESPEHSAESVGLAWAKAIGCARAGIMYTTFAAEAETDLFGEQAVLCGGLSSLITAAFETLVDAGYDPKLAYIECCQEVKQIADLIYERGLAGMREAISNTAEFGEYHAGPRLVDEHTRARLRELLEEIRNGRFARQLAHEHARGFKAFHQRRDQLSRHPIEGAGRAVRSLMPRPGGPHGANRDDAIESPPPDRR